MLSICAAVGQVGPSAAWGVVGSVEQASRKRRGSDRSRCFMVVRDSEERKHEYCESRMEPQSPSCVRNIRVVLTPRNLMSDG